MVKDIFVVTVAGGVSTAGGVTSSRSVLHLFGLCVDSIPRAHRVARAREFAEADNTI